MFDTLKAAAADKSDAQLIAALRLLDQTPGKLNQEQNLVRAIMCDVLEKRHPEVTRQLDAWADGDWMVGATYTAVLFAALADLGVAA